MLTINPILRQVPDLYPHPVPNKKGDRSLEIDSAYRLLNWYARWYCPETLRYMGHTDEAFLLEALPWTWDSYGISKILDALREIRVSCAELDTLQRTVNVFSYFDRNPYDTMAFDTLTRVWINPYQACAHPTYVVPDHATSWVAMACQAWPLFKTEGWEGHVATWHVDQIWENLRDWVSQVCQAHDRVEHLPWWACFPSFSKPDEGLGWESPTQVSVLLSIDKTAVMGVGHTTPRLFDVVGEAKVRHAFVQAGIGFSPMYLGAYVQALRVKAHQEGWSLEFPTLLYDFWEFGVHDLHR